MIHTNAYVYQDPVETTATSVCLITSEYVVFLTIKSSNISGINKELSEWAAIFRANVL